MNGSIAQNAQIAHNEHLPVTQRERCLPGPRGGLAAASNIDARVRLVRYSVPRRRSGQLGGAWLVDLRGAAGCGRTARRVPALRPGAAREARSAMALVLAGGASVIGFAECCCCAAVAGAGFSSSSRGGSAAVGQGLQTSGGHRWNCANIAASGESGTR